MEEIRLDISVTGARSGDVLIGIQKCTTKAMIRIYLKDVKPLKKRLDFYRKDKDIWYTFLDKIGSIKYFSKMTIKQREEWMDENQTDIEFLGDDEDGIGIQVLQTGESDLNTKIIPEKLDDLINGNQTNETGYWTNSEIENFIPSNPGGKKVRKHTLFFLKWFWQISNECNKAGFIEMCRPVGE